MSSSAGSSASCSSASDDESEDAVLRLLSKPKRTRVRRPVIDKLSAPWQLMLDNAKLGINGVADPDSRDGKYFRRRFRVPYILFTTIVDVAIGDGWFPGDFEVDGRGVANATGERGASLHVKILSVLRVLGRGDCFDDCFDGSNCSESSLSVWFHKFMRVFVERFVCVHQQ
jgi:hypothetical protein